jgi:hypothetical protein
MGGPSTFGKRNTEIIMPPHDLSSEMSQSKNAGHFSPIFKAGRVSVDVTDLLSLDFEISEEIFTALVHVACKSPSASARGISAELQDLLASILDRISDRTIELGRRLCSASERDQVDARWGGLTTRQIAAECERVNRLGYLATREDFVALGVSRRDNVSRMKLTQLRRAVGDTRWLEIQLRLRSAGCLTSERVRIAAQWHLRGLEMKYALLKAQMRVRRRVQ